MRKEKSCGTIVFNKNKVLLIVQSNNNICGFPKGHMEKGESEIQTAIRETKEETNIDIEVYKNYRYEVSYTVKDNVPKDVVYYLAKAKSFDEEKQAGEISKVFWVDKDIVKNKLTYNNMIELYEQALEDSKKIVGLNK